jgi:hypothetical protein
MYLEDEERRKFSDNILWRKFHAVKHKEYFFKESKLRTVSEFVVASSQNWAWSGLPCKTSHSPRPRSVSISRCLPRAHAAQALQFPGTSVLPTCGTGSMFLSSQPHLTIPRWLLPFFPRSKRRTCCPSNLASQSSVAHATTSDFSSPPRHAARHR